MYLWIMIQFLLGFVTSSRFRVDLPDDFPPIHAMDDFNRCKAKGDLFCRIKFSLSSKIPENRAWQMIQATKNNSKLFDRDIIYRFRCVSKIFNENIVGIEENTTMKENIILRKLALQAKVEDLECSSYSKKSYLTRYDFILYFVTLGWLGLIGLATILDIIKRAGFRCTVSQSSDILSVLSNWEDLSKPDQNEDQLKLRNIQGIRTLNMTIVVMGHTILNALFSFSADTTYIEEFYRTSYKKFSLNMGLHVVQTNFLISGWLFASNMYSYLENNKKLTVTFTSKLVLSRYLRLIPPLTFLICWEMSNWPVALIVGPPLERERMDYRACQKNWWATLLLINNLFLSSDMCNLGTWYLSNDFQMFIAATFIFYLASNSTINKKVIVGTLGLVWFIHAYLIYANNLGVIFDFTPENAKVENSVGSYKLKILYTSFYANYASYAVGLIFGGLYHKYKFHQTEVSKTMKLLWLLFFCGLPLSATYFSLFEYSRLLSAVIGASLKPIFTAGIAIGIFGMSHTVGGIIKNLCESKMLVFLSKWTYCIYIVHFPIVFGRYATMNEPIPLNDRILVTSIVSDLIQSFMAGLVLHLVIERPFAKIVQKVLSTKTSNKIKSV